MHFTFEGRPVHDAGRPTLPKQLVMRLIGAITSLPKQVVLTMQLSAILLFAVCLQVSAAGYSQTVSFTGKDVPLKDVLAAVKKQTGFGVFYASGEKATLEGVGNVTVDVKNVGLDAFLQICLKGLPLEYSLEGSTIFIRAKEPHLVSSSSPTSETIPEIKGHVTNEKTEALINANIIIKRTGRGTITDANGNFILHNVNTGDVLQVSFIGYKTQSITVSNGNHLVISMEPTTNNLDKVVIQAYGTTSQRLSTGNIGVVRAEDIEKQPIMNPIAALQGQVAGLVVTSTSGFASSPVKIEIRGRNTINTNFPSDPLYIIDGVPLTVMELSGISNYGNGSQGFIQSGLASPANGQSPFFSINPSDIESIEVLKDADATAIYGSRGSNGVILITTKKGTPGKSRFDLSYYQGISQAPRHYAMMNTKQFVAMRLEAFKNDSIDPDIYNAPDITVWDTTRNTDWQKYLWGHLGKTSDLEASLSAGDLRTTFRIGTGYHRETSILTASGADQKASFSAAISHKTADQRLTISLNAMYTFASSDLIFLPGGATTLPPNAPSVFTPSGKLNYNGWSPLQGVFTFQSLLTPYSAKTNFLNSSLILNYEIVKGLFLRTTFGYNNTHANQSYFTPIASQDPQYDPKGSAGFGYNFFHNLIIEPQAEYNAFLSKGKLNVLLGGTLQKNVTDGVLLTGSGYLNDNLLHSINNAPSKASNDNYGEYKYNGVFGRINYNWQNQYIINLNIRRDGSSRFGPGRQFGNFGSVGGAWIFTENKWIKTHLPALSFGKVRGSYGTTGSDQIGDYQYLTQWGAGSYAYNNTLPLLLGGNTDSMLHWQVNQKLEFSFEFGFLNDRLIFQISRYQHRCNDQLVPFPTPLITGYNKVISNSPANVQNSGWEFTTNSRVVDNENFKWNIKFNIGINRNKLLSYPKFEQSPYASTLAVGRPLSIAYLLHYTGVDPETGFYTFQDKNKDGEITVDYGKPGAGDDRYIVDLTPQFDGGLTNSFNYKNWKLDLLFYFRKQKGINALNSIGNPGGGFYNVPTAVLNRWRKPGDVAMYAKFTTMPNANNNFSYNNYQISDALYTDASFIRLQNLAISYNFPKVFMKKLGVKSLSLNIRCENVFIITKYKGIDPETQDFGGLPRPRVLTAGILCNF